MKNKEKNTSRTDSLHEDCNNRVAELDSKLKEQETKYLYLYAEFENFKKRTNQDRIQWFKFGWEPLATELLQVIDNTERAIQHATQDVSSGLKEGLHMTLNQLKAVLEKQGVKRLDTVEKAFDPEFHEAIGKEDSPHPSGIIIREEVPGYTLHGRLLRPARVVISSGVQSKTTPSAA